MASKRFHVNEKGEPGECNATKRPCPLGFSAEEHFPTVVAAREAYEAKQGSQVLATLNKREPVPPEEGTYIVREENYRKALASLERANKRLEKEGASERFTYDFEEKYRKKQLAPGLFMEEKYYKLRLNTPRLAAHGGYEFQAAVTKAEKGFLVRSAPGVEMGGVKPEAMTCEHCGQSRDRAKTYLIKGPDGSTKQIGSSCVEAYTGITPEGLWMLEYAPSSTEEAFDEQKEPADRDTFYAPVDTMLAVSLVVSDNGRNYVSTSSYQGEPTAYRVRNLLYSRARTDAEEKERQAILKKASKLVEDGTVASFRKTLEGLPGRSDYESNIKTLALGGHVQAKEATLLISSVSILAKEERAAEREQQRQARLKKSGVRDSFTPGHYGRPDEKIAKGTKFTVVERSGYTKRGVGYRSEDVPASRLVMQDSEGHQVVWFAPRELDCEPGEAVEVSSGKVKSHGQYRGVDQTIVSNVRLVEAKK